MNPRQNRAFDDYCDKLAIDGGIVSLADRWHPVYQTLSVHLCRAESVRSFNDDMPWRNFPSPEFRTQFQRELFQQVPVFPMQYSICQKKPACPKPADSTGLYMRYPPVPYPLVTDLDTVTWP